MTYFSKKHACSSVTNLACTVQEVITAAGFKPMNTGADTKQQSDIAQARHLPSITNAHLQE